MSMPKMPFTPSQEYIDRAYAMVELQQQGWTYAEIANEYGLSRHTVNASLCWLRKLDPTVFRRRRLNPPDNHFLLTATAYERNPRLAARNKQWSDRLDAGDNVDDIAADWGVTPEFVYCGSTLHRKTHNMRLNQLRGVA